MSARRALVTGAGGFIGHHLVSYLVATGHWVRGGDEQQPGYGVTDAHDSLIADLREEQNGLAAAAGVDDIYHLAADMGGIGFITSQHALIARNNTLINLAMLEAARQTSIKRFLYSSSAC